jgi:hypothetical protein
MQRTALSGGCIISQMSDSRTLASHSDGWLAHL